MLATRANKQCCHSFYEHGIALHKKRFSIIAMSVFEKALGRFRHRLIPSFHRIDATL
jgi:hypothetical protein